MGSGRRGSETEGEPWEAPFPNPAFQLGRLGGEETSLLRGSGSLLRVTRAEASPGKAARRRKVKLPPAATAEAERSRRAQGTGSSRADQ